MPWPRRLQRDITTLTSIPPQRLPHFGNHIQRKAQWQGRNTASITGFRLTPETLITPSRIPRPPPPPLLPMRRLGRRRRKEQRRPVIVAGLSKQSAMRAVLTAAAARKRGLPACTETLPQSSISPFHSPICRPCFNVLIVIGLIKRPLISWRAYYDSRRESRLG
jgi:hypothetical protein